MNCRKIKAYKTAKTFIYLTIQMTNAVRLIRAENSPHRPNQVSEAMVCFISVFATFHDVLALPAKVRKKSEPTKR